MTTEPHTLMKSYLSLLRNSQYLTNITEDDINSIVVPEVGTLIKALELNLGKQLIERIEEIPSSFSSGFNASAAVVFGTHFSNFRATSTVNGTFFSGFFTATSVNGTFFSDFNGTSFRVSFSYENCKNSWRNASFNFGTFFNDFRASNGSFWDQNFFAAGRY